MDEVRWVCFHECERCTVKLLTMQNYIALYCQLFDGVEFSYEKIDFNNQYPISLYQNQNLNIHLQHDKYAYFAIE